MLFQWSIIWPTKENETLIHATAWVNWETQMACGRIQSLKTTYLHKVFMIVRSVWRQQNSGQEESGQPKDTGFPFLDDENTLKLTGVMVA